MDLTKVDAFSRQMFAVTSNIYPTKARRTTRTKLCVNNALQTLKDYYDYNMISKQYYDECKKQIKDTSTNDDRISAIMKQTRHKIFN